MNILIFFSISATILLSTSICKAEDPPAPAPKSNPSSTAQHEGPEVPPRDGHLFGPQGLLHHFIHQNASGEGPSGTGGSILGTIIGNGRSQTLPAVLPRIRAALEPLEQARQSARSKRQTSGGRTWQSTNSNNRPYEGSIPEAAGVQEMISLMARQALREADAYSGNSDTRNTATPRERLESPYPDRNSPMSRNNDERFSDSENRNWRYSYGSFRESMGRRENSGTSFPGN